MTTYRTTGFSTTDFDLIDFSVQSEAIDPILDYSVNWRDPNWFFNSSFDIEAYDVLIGETSILAPNPYLDTYFLRYDWGASQTTFLLGLYDQVSAEGYVILLGGDLFDVTQAATFWPQVISGTAANPLPGTGFASGEGVALTDLPGVVVTENDLIIGTDGPDLILSGIGDDTIKGRPGDDTLDGQGDDDLVDGGGGNDLLFGGDGVDLLLGSFGDDTLDGGAGADTLDGGEGSDTFYVDEDDLVKESRNFTGIDRIVAGFDYTLVGHYEELELTGTEDLRGVGNDLDNTLIGNAGDNTLDGGIGDDTLAGRDGDDTYYLRDPGDVIVERAGLGFDTVHTWLGDTSAMAHIEALVLRSTGNANLSGNTLHNALTGNMDDNVLRGGLGNDTLIGLAGDDTLIGGDGYDLLSGGDGSDTYILTSPFYYWQQDTVRESAGHSGTDLVLTNADVDLRSEHVENVTVSAPGSSTIDIFMNGLDNLVRGSAGRENILTYDGADTILAGAGHDTLNGGAGADHMSGGAGNDSYYVSEAADRIIESAGGGTDTVYSAIDYTLAATLERLTLTGSAQVGNGNDGNNILRGNDQHNLLQGLAGNDSLYGSYGNDTLRGGTGADYMEGSYGNDTYFMDNTGDSIQNEHYYSGGADRVISSVSFTGQWYSRIEIIDLIGSDDIDARAYYWTRSAQITGNSGDNTLTGTYYGDTLLGGDGDDRLFGQSGGNYLNGGDGNDYLNGGSGVDTLLGGDGNDTLLGDRSDVLRGEAGNDELTGAVLSVLLGGIGDDTYTVEHKLATVIEGAGAGHDTVLSYVSRTLSAHVEDLELLGNSDTDGIGNSLDNTITGNDGINVLVGNGGNDTLTGGAGADTFFFNKDLGANNVDTIMDLSRNADTIRLSSNVFTALSGMAGGALSADALRGGGVAIDADDHIIYDRDTGELFYDADGVGGADQVLFAVLDNMTLLNADVFQIV